MSHCRLRRMVATVLAALTLQAQAALVTDNYANASHNAFFDKNAEGWFWYHDPLPEEEKPEEELPEMPPIPIPQIEGKTETPAPAPFSLAWVKAMLPKYMEAAWNNPTEQNVEAYFLIQRFAIDRATNFANMAQRVVVGNTALDETMRRPLSAPGATQANLNYAEKTQQMMKKVAEHAGLWFFFRSDCRFCEAQAPILGFLEQEGFPVFAISIDGGQLQSRQFEHTYKDSGHAAKLGVTATPAIFMVSESGRFDALGMSVLTLSDLRQRILLVAARNGILSEKDFKEATPIMNPNQQRDLSKELPQLIQASTNPAMAFGSEKSSQAMLALADKDLSHIMDKDNFIEPAKLVELVGKRKTGAMNEEETEDYFNAVSLQ